MTLGQKAALSAMVGSVIMLLAGCASSSRQEQQKAYTPHIDPAEFTTTIDNEYFPMKPGTVFLYKGGTERDEMTVTHSTKMVMGVECVVVDDRAWEGGQLVEKTYDWFAQDKEGSVWYFGEDTKEYENGEVVSTKGSWGGRGGRSQTRHHNAGRPRSRSVLPPGVLSRGGYGHGQSAKLGRFGDGVLRILRSRARDQRVDAAGTWLLREEVLRSWGRTAG
jgi:hypothetical protein